MDELADEIEAINAIYPDSLTKESDRIFSLTLPELPIRIRISFPSSYPESRPPHALSVDGVSGQNPNQLIDDLFQSVYSPGQVCMFEFIEAGREVLATSDLNPSDDEGANPDSVVTAARDAFEGWTLSEQVIDRKSMFIGHAIEVHSAEQAMEKITNLKLDKRIGRAAHNITAWRIQRQDGVLVQDCDDDGETAAGGRLLHLLQLTGSINACVCVSRWYGGIHLGPDRFKHINSVARDALLRGGFIKEGKKSSRS